jgi:hypothetical protein
MDRAGSAVTTPIAVLAEVAGWAAGAANRTETFAWFRVQAYLGPGGAALALLAGIALAALRLRRLPPPWLGALTLHALLLLDVPQGQPDTATWFTLAQHVARDPLGALADWPAVAWSGPEGRFHRPFPLVPLVYGLAFRVAGERPEVTDAVMTGFAVAFPLAVTWAARGLVGPTRERTARLAGWVAATTPFVASQAGWMLADLPLAVTVALAWGAVLRAVRHGTARGWILAALASLPAVLTKATGLAFVLLPTMALLLPLPVFVGLLAGGGLLVAGLRPPRLHDAGTYALGALGFALHLRGAAWVIGLSAHGRALGGPASRLLLGVAACMPAIALWAPVEHGPRYALPVAGALALVSAAHAPAVARFLVGSGFVLLTLGYLPILRHAQAVNLRDATRQLEAAGATCIEVRVDAPDSTFPAAPLAALVDYYATVPVRTGPSVSLAPPGQKRRWWEFTEPPPWRGPPDDACDGLLVGHFGSEPEALPGWEPIGTVSRYRASSLVLPQVVGVHRR